MESTSMEDGNACYFELNGASKDVRAVVTIDLGPDSLGAGSMCTLSVLPRTEGYILGMNRDERSARPMESPPEIFTAGECNAIYPRDHVRGTWVGANDRGISFALLNWNDVVPRGGLPTAAQSRGTIIPAVLQSRSMHQVRSVLRALWLDGTPPFRLFGIFPVEQCIREWRWDTARLISLEHLWQAHHEFSSSLSDRKAEELRGAVCREAADHGLPGSVPWLRALHSSHANGPGGFSICVHRETVRTLSYTEIICSAEALHLTYFPGSPCLGLARSSEESPHAERTLSLPIAVENMLSAS